VIKSFSESALWSVVDEAAKMTKAMATSTRKVIVWKCEVGHMVYDPKIKEWKSKYSGGSLMFDKDGLRLTLHAGVFEERVEKLSDTTGRKKFEAVNSKIPRAYYPDIRNVYELDEVPEDSVVIPWQKDKELFLVKKLQEVAESIRSLRVITLAGFQYMIDSREEDGDDR
jgi:hypothetical protein